MAVNLRPAGVSDGKPDGQGALRGGVQQVDAFGTPFAPTPLTLVPPVAPLADTLPVVRSLVGPGLGVAMALPLLSGDTPQPPAPSVAGHGGLGVEVGQDGKVTIRRPDGLFSSTPLMQFPAELQRNLSGLQGRLHDADGRTVGTFHDSVLHLEPETQRSLDTILDALTDGAGQPPRPTEQDESDCQEVPKGEPGRAAGMDTLEQRDRIPAALQADSSRARALVQRIDPVLNMPLAGLKPSDWQAHHLVTREAAGSKEFAPVFDAAAAAGWREDGMGNLIGLPTNCPAQERLERLGVHRPLHNGSHPIWSEDVRNELARINGTLSESGLNAHDPAYQQLARGMMESLQSHLRAKLGGMERVVELPHFDAAG